MFPPCFLWLFVWSIAYHGLFTALLFYEAAILIARNSKNGGDGGDDDDDGDADDDDADDDDDDDHDNGDSNWCDDVVERICKNQSVHNEIDVWFRGVFDRWTSYIYIHISCLQKKCLINYFVFIHVCLQTCRGSLSLGWSFVTAWCCSRKAKALFFPNNNSFGVFNHYKGFGVELLSDFLWF